MLYQLSYAPTSSPVYPRRRPGTLRAMTDQPYDERDDEREAQYAAIHEEEPEDPLLDDLEEEGDPEGALRDS